MANGSFQKFVAVFVGVLLAFGATAAIITGDEDMIVTAIAVGVLYAVYMVLFIKRQKQRKAQSPQEKQSPLLRR